MFKTILPSSLLSYAEPSYYNAFGQSFDNVALRIGIVKSVSKIEAKDNVDAKVLEYDVMVFQQDKDKGVIPITYKNCVTMDSFGGIGDFFEFVKSVPTGQSGSLTVDDGSYVLLLCIDGTVTRGVIIGALPHHGRKSTLTKAKDKHMEGEYNGLRFKINDDGELTLTFKGKTNNKGVPKTPKNAGSQIKMEKDGSVEINDRDIEPELAAGNDKQGKVSGAAPASTYEKVRIDKTKQSIDIVSRKDQNQNAGANYNLTVKTKTTHKTAEWIAAASGKASLSSGGVFDIKAGGAFNLAAADIKMKSDAAMQVQANSIQLNAQQVAVGQGGTPAIIGSTQFVGIGNAGAPVISTAMGPFSATVTIAP
jgi:hypothetical protein